MKIAILSRGLQLYSTRRLKEACLKRGHKALILNTTRFSINIAQGNPTLSFKNKPLSKYDAVIPRIGASITFFGTAVVRQFEQMGVYCLNSSQAISVSRDKLRAIQALSRHNIGVPLTTFASQKGTARSAVEAVGGAPVIIKLLEGTQGVGVILAESVKTAEAIIETLQSKRQDVLVQKFVAESKGRDIRAFVVGGRVVAAMRRVASGDEFRSNIHRGGHAEPVKLDSSFESTAIRAAQIMGLNVAGVDMLEGKDGPMLMEVNSSPGLEGIETSTGIDVAGAIVEFMEGQVLFPEVDIRQRLTLGRGYGVAEISVTEASDLKGKTIQATALRERDIVVLTILRGSQNIANPRPERQILAGDKLVCFGNLLAMSSILQAKPAS